MYIDSLTDYSEPWPITVIEHISNIERAKNDLYLIEQGLDPAFENDLNKDEVSPLKVAYFEYLGEVEFQTSAQFQDMGNEKLANDFLRSSQMWESEFFKLVFNEYMDEITQEIRKIESNDFEKKLALWDEINSLTELTSAELIARGNYPSSQERFWRRIINAKNKAKDKHKILTRKMKRRKLKGKKNKRYYNYRCGDYPAHRR